MTLTNNTMFMVLLCFRCEGTAEQAAGYFTPWQWIVALLLSCFMVSCLRDKPPSIVIAKFVCCDCSKVSLLKMFKQGEASQLC